MILLAWNWDYFWYDLAIEIGGSFIFLFAALFLLRPRITIGSTIANYMENGENIYRFKFVNNSWFSAYDALVELYEHTEKPANPAGRDVFPRQLPLITSRFSMVPRFVPKRFAKTYAHHCFQVKTLINLSDILIQDDKSLQLRITLKHGLTGLSKNFVKDFNTIRTVKHGEFEFGNSFNIN